jgi:DNA replication protein DnaC
MGHPMQIKEIATELKLPYIKNNYQNLINQANQTSMAYDEFLLGILENEYELRKSNSVARRLRNARFPMKKYLIL